MVDIKISDLPAAGSVADTMEFEVNDSGTSRKVTGAQIKDSVTGLTVAKGGTGATTFTDAGVLIGNGTSAIQVTTAGTTGQVLTSNGTGVDPTFQNASIVKSITSVTNSGHTLTPTTAKNIVTAIQSTSILSIDTFANQAIPIGTIVDLATTDQPLVIVALAGVTVNTDAVLCLRTNQSGRLIKRGTDTWVFEGPNKLIDPPFILESYNSPIGTGAIGISENLAVSGDLIIRFFETAAEAIATPAGWTEAANSPQSTGTAAGAAATRLHVFYRVADGVSDGFSAADPGDHFIGLRVIVKNANTTSPFNVTAGAVAASATTAVSMPTVTTTVEDCLIIQAVTNATDTATDQLPTVANASIRNITNVSNNDTSGNGGGVNVIFGNRTTPGAISATTGTLATSSVQAKWTGAINPR